MRLILPLYWLACFALTHVPLPLPPEQVLFDGADKSVHLVMYGGLAALLALRWPRPWWQVVAVVVAYAVFDETTQPLVNRNCDIFDFLFDTAGAICGAGAVALWRRGRASRSPRGRSTDVVPRGSERKPR